MTSQTITGAGWRIQVLGHALVRFEYSPEGQFVDAPTQVVVARPCTETAVQVERRGEGVQVITSHFQLDYDGAAPTASGLSVKARGSYHSVWRYGAPFENPFAPLFAKRINLGGTTRTLDTVDGRCALDDGILSDLGISVLDDSRSFVVGDDGEPTPPPAGHVDVYVFAHGKDHPATLADFAGLTGPTPLIPRYALGNWWSRYHRYSAESYTALMDRFEADDLPFSVAVIDMDWHVTDVDPRYGNGWTGYSWNRELFPDPEGFLADLHSRGLAVTLNTHPADGIRAFEDAYPRVCELMGRDPDDGLPADFDLTDPVFRRAYFEAVHHPLEEQGVDFWWLDWQQGGTSRTGIDPLWLLNHLHVEDLRARGKRPLILSRYSGPGSHRFPVGFSGDTVASWASLAFQPEFTATAANIGYGTWSHDIGGHVMGVRDDELALRWLQFGVFSPINRLHSSNEEFAGKEPWKYRDDVAAHMGTFLRLRHALVPYLYTEWATGEPLVRPMYHTHPHVQAAYEVPGQYTFGRALIVAPIVTPLDDDTRLGAVDAWLPEGRWVDLFTGLAYDGDRFVTMHRGLASIPVLARAGTVLPMAAPGERAGELPSAVELWIVPGADGEYTLVEDDGALEPATATTTIRWDDAARVVVVEAPAGAADVLPGTRTWRVRLIGEGGDQLLDAGRTDGGTLRWEAPPAQPSIDVEERCRRLVDAAQTEVRHKSTAMDVIRRGLTPLRTAQALRDAPVRGAVPGEITRLPSSLVAALEEVVTATE